MKTSNKMIIQATLYTNITPKFKFQTTPKQRYNTRDTKKAVKKHTEPKMRKKREKTD